MSDNYNWHSWGNMVDCNSFKACYQICRQLKRHGFSKAYEMTMGNTRVISYVKNETDISVYIYNGLTDPLTRRKISYIDYIESLTNDHYRPHRKGDRHV